MTARIVVPAIVGRGGTAHHRDAGRRRLVRRSGSGERDRLHGRRHAGSADRLGADRVGADRSVNTRLVISSGHNRPNASGLYFFDGAAVRLIDPYPCAGLSTHGGRLYRAAPLRQGDGAEMLVYDEQGVCRYQRIDGVGDPHDVLALDGDRVLCVSSRDNAIVSIAPDGTLVTRLARGRRDRRVARELSGHARRPAVRDGVRPVRHVPRLAPDARQRRRHPVRRGDRRHGRRRLVAAALAALRRRRVGDLQLRRVLGGARGGERTPHHDPRRRFQPRHGRRGRVRVRRREHAARKHPHGGDGMALRDRPRAVGRGRAHPDAVQRHVRRDRGGRSRSCTGSKRASGSAATASDISRSLRCSSKSA